MPVHVFPDSVCACVCLCVPAGAACSSVCLYIPALTVRPALRHCARLHLRPRNVLSSSSSSQHLSHFSPTPSAGQWAPPHSPGQADLPGIWIDRSHLHSPGPRQGQEVGKEYITAKCSGLGQGRAEAAWTQQTFCSFSEKEFHYIVRPGWEESTLFPIIQWSEVTVKTKRKQKM